jgi:hypothetical protein
MTLMRLKHGPGAPAAALGDPGDFGRCG